MPRASRGPDGIQTESGRNRMAAHTQAMRRGAPDTFCIVSMPRSMPRDSYATRDVALLNRDLQSPANAINRPQTSAPSQ